MSEESTEVTDVQEDTQEDIQEPEINELWSQVAPELANAVKDMTPQAREDYLLKLAAKHRNESPSDEKNASQDGKQDKAGQPSATRVPNVDIDQLVADMKDAIESGDGDKFANAATQQMSLVQAAVSVMERALQASNGRWDQLSNELKGLTLPNQIRSVKVNGATDDDYKSAMEILRGGEVTTPEAAVKLAVANRILAGDAGTDARRKAQALKASQGSGANRSLGKVRSDFIPHSVTSDLIRQMEEEAKQ